MQAEEKHEQGVKSKDEEVEESETTIDCVCKHIVVVQ